MVIYLFFIVFFYINLCIYLKIILFILKKIVFNYYYLF